MILRNISVRNKIYNQIILTIQIGSNSIVGYIFLKILAAEFGTSAETDSFLIAYSVPFLILSISGLSLIQSIAAVNFTRMRSLNYKNIDNVFSAVTILIFLSGTFFIIIFCIFSKEIVLMLAPGLNAGAAAGTRLMILLLMPLVFTLGLSTYFSAVLNAYSIPVSMEFCQLVSRGGVIAWAFSKGSTLTLHEIAILLVFFSFTGAIAEWIILKKTTGLKFKFYFNIKEPEFHNLINQGLGFILVSLFAQLAMIVMRRLGTIDGEGTTSVIIYALSLVGPFSIIFGKPISLTFGLESVKSILKNDFSKAKNIFFRSLIMGFIISLILILIISFFNYDIISLLYGGGKFNENSILETSKILSILKWSIPSSIMLWAVISPLLSSGAKHSAAFIYITGYVLHIILSYALFYAFSKTGLAIAYTLSVSIQMLLGLAYVAKIFKKQMNSVQ